MSKIMLVEDDNNLREIYGARLEAEGHQIVTASDGEEALAIAVKEKPDLIISDVMMPRVSGFDMLDILRNAPETKDTKIIMMTALSQAEDKARADKLGADKYLVKSQVTLEDVANVVREILGGEPTPTPETIPDPAPTPTTEAPAPTVQTVPVASAPAPAPEPTQTTVATPTPATPPAPAPEPTVQDIPVVAPPAENTTVPAPAPETPAPTVQTVPVASAPAPAPEPTQTTAGAPTPIKIDVTEEPSAQAPETTVTEPAPTTPAPETPVAPTVVLPTPPDEIKEEPKAEPTPTEPVTIEPTAPVVGPTLAEALASEEASASSSQEPDVTPGGPERPVDPLDDEHGKKKIIEPLNDITKGPDLQALLEAEEQKASATAQAPPAQQPTPSPTSDTTPAPEAPGDPHSKIAL